MKLKIFKAILCVLPLTFFSCEDWLNISSRSQIIADEQFSSEAGYKDALTGIYILISKPDLYGRNMTWRCAELLSQQYAVVAMASDLDVARYEYRGTAMGSYREAIWLKQYNVIANINNLIKWREKTGDVMHPVMDSIVYGEALALRAFCHLDLMRMFGKGNLGNRPEVMDELAVPYVTEYVKHIPRQYTYRENFRLMFEDLETALKYLEADPIKSRDDRDRSYYDAVKADGFIAYDRSDRRKRMNYYSCLALYARALMWEGSDKSREKALEICRELINPTNISSNTLWYSWVSSTNLSNNNYLERDNSFKNEHLWSLYIDDFVEYQRASYGTSVFDGSSPGNNPTVLYMNYSRAQYVYEIESGITSDWRYTKCLEREAAATNNMSILKFRDQESDRKNETYRNRMPLMRISEIFYTAAECLADTDPQGAMDYLNVVRRKRNIPASMDLTGLSAAQIRDEITKEYMKEFVAEGQLFFYYKRTGQEYIYGYSEAMTDLQYVIPMPDSEIENGFRE